MTSWFRQIKSASSAPASVARDWSKIVQRKKRLCLLNALVLLLRQYERENSPHSSKQRSSARAQGALSTISGCVGHAHTERILAARERSTCWNTNPLKGAVLFWTYIRISFRYDGLTKNNLKDISRTFFLKKKIPSSTYYWLIRLLKVTAFTALTLIWKLVSVTE